MITTHLLNKMLSMVSPQVTTSTDTTVAVTQRRGDTLQEMGTFLAYLRNTFHLPAKFSPLDGFH